MQRLFTVQTNAPIRSRCADADCLSLCLVDTGSEILVPIGISESSWSLWGNPRTASSLPWKRACPTGRFRPIQIPRRK
jgi:hypothetical protein